MADRIDTSALEKRAPRKAPVRKTAGKAASKMPSKAPPKLEHPPISRGNLNDLWLYEIPNVKLEAGHLELIDAVAIPANTDGLSGQFTSALGQLDSSLRERIGQYLGAASRAGSKSLPDELPLAQLLDDKR